ncbi:arylamine N-acetyltransferase [Oxalobacteraceae bacterium]|nr:arylamine N-acetyltransferase [Oxalobacteraceae bacterium]
MHAENFVLQDYLDRIGFQGEAKADLATLQAMMRAQLFTVPFENLDVQAGKIISLVPEQIVDKIVKRRRGGYCYEVNGTFAMALQALGIPYQFAAARPMFYPVLRPKTHMVIVATLAGVQWLCDLGFGSYGIRAPMRLDLLDTEVAQDADTYMLSMSSPIDYVLKAKVDGEWASQFGFNLSPQEWIDFAPANYMNSTHPDAIFVQKLLVVLFNPQGRTILMGEALKTVVDGKSRTRRVAAQERATLLRELFGLETGGD